MSPEQEIGNNMDPIFEDADIPSLSAAIAVYVTAFSKPPFNETWEVLEGEVDTENISGLSRFISEVLREPEELIIQELPEGTQNMYFKDTTIKTIYPLNKIASPYLRAMNNPETLLALKDTLGNIYLLSDGERMNGNTEPQAVARFVNYSQQEMPQLLGEIEPYIVDKENLKKIASELSEEKRILYLGEIVNLNNSLIQQGSFSRQTLELYKQKYGDNLPDTVLYLTKPGTGVERSGKKEELNNRFIRALIEKNYPKGTTFEHSKMELNKGEETSIIYISKIR